MNDESTVVFVCVLYRTHWLNQIFIFIGTKNDAIKNDKRLFQKRYFNQKQETHRIISLFKRPCVSLAFDFITRVLKMYCNIVSYIVKTAGKQIRIFLMQSIEFEMISQFNKIQQQELTSKHGSKQNDWI